MAPAGNTPDGKLIWEASVRLDGETPRTVGGGAEWQSREGEREREIRMKSLPREREAARYPVLISRRFKFTLTSEWSHDAILEKILP